jgi:hypothetical protein
MYLSSCSGLALSVTFGDRFPFLSLARHLPPARASPLPYICRYKKAHRNSPVTDCRCALHIFVLCSVSARVIRQYPQREQPLLRPRLRPQQALPQRGRRYPRRTADARTRPAPSHSSQRTSHSSQRCDNSDQTGFLHRFSTLLFGRTSGPAIFSGRSAAQARSILKLLYPDFTKITTKKAKFCFFQSPSFFLYALNAPGRVYSFCSCSRLAQTQPAGASALPTQTE